MADSDFSELDCRPCGSPAGPSICPPGPPGVNGVNNGLVCLTGTGAPANSVGNDGDLYIDTVAQNLYGPKMAGIWNGPIELSGTAGGDLAGSYPNPTLAVITAAGTGTKVTIDAKGRVTNLGALSPSDIPGGVELQSNKGQDNGYAGLDANALLEPTEFPILSGVIATTAGSTVTTMNSNVVSNSNLTQMATLTVKANNTGVTANPQDVTFAALAAALGLAVSAVKTIHRQVFTYSGTASTFTATYTPTTGMIYADVEVLGGGGGGGGAAGAASQSAGGGGGGGGAYCRRVMAAATIGSSQTITIGQPAAGGAVGANNGTNGTSVSFGSLLVAGGGAAGSGATSSAASVSGTTSSAGGISSTGDFQNVGGMGGGGVGFGSSAAAIGGFGGSTYYSGATPGAMLSGNGNNAAANYGGGGSGAAAGATSTAGGIGASGIVIITEYCSQ